jgi:hypothetical protein
LVSSGVLPSHQSSGDDGRVSLSESLSGLHGKINHVKILKQHPEFQKAFAELGAAEDLDNTVLSELERFTCLLYGRSSADVNRVRYEKFIERFSTKEGQLLSSYDGVDMSLLPPCNAPRKS